MNLHDEIMQDIYETVDAMRTQDRRIRAVELCLEARKAHRAGAFYTAEKRYLAAAEELKKSSNDEAHRAAERLEEQAYILRNKRPTDARWSYDDA